MDSALGEEDCEKQTGWAGAGDQYLRATVRLFRCMIDTRTFSKDFVFEPILTTSKGEGESFCLICSYPDIQRQTKVHFEGNTLPLNLYAMFVLPAQ
jgi:hypothetical protein